MSLENNNLLVKNKGKVVAVCISREKGTRKKAIKEGVLAEDHGLQGDAHASSLTHRQVSLLAIESIEKMRQKGLELLPGDFAENITTQGIDLTSLKCGMLIRVGKEALLEITQLGKMCHKGCEIMKLTGDCIMPKEGIFARVIKGGRITAGDSIIIEKT